jgi:hypothetical protein
VAVAVGDHGHVVLLRAHRRSSGSRGWGRRRSVPAR